jgi:ubiquinone biosynthesis protein Coq4
VESFKLSALSDPEISKCRLYRDLLRAQYLEYSSNMGSNMKSTLAVSWEFLEMPIVEYFFF